MQPTLATGLKSTTERIFYVINNFLDFEYFD